MSELLNFLTDFAVDPQSQVAFAENPEGVIEAANLSKVNEATLKSGDKTKITEAFVDELQTNDLAAIVGSCIIGDPGPDPTPDPDPPEPPSK